ncbi:MAG: zinc metalloprotease [Flavobacterium sp.]|uniref:zinc metalloprotease n=1 Tax=Flavobacterium sp. TaxID=239 RepID=UPI000C6AC3F6|nr:zinc metalloprotease [Flavobacterium sp.]MBF05046.1 zinc metalloprotease [Flavobacterium sp.]|tara:strand:- start:183 stop:1127 length:945 start_codon:yes stop_codon:yes gene_type:complete
MKKVFLSMCAMMLLFSCNNEDKSVEETTESAIAHRGCATDEVLQRQLKEDPGLAQRMKEIELETKQFISEGRIVNGVLEIPVVFNVLYRTSAENISQSQLQSQIDVLNNDFRGSNSDYNASNPYNSVRGAINVRFVLDKVVRKQTTKTSWGTNDAMKRTSSGGIAPTSPTTKLNYWVCTIGGGILGYAQFPGGSSSTDGVVIDSKYTGTNGTATYPFNKGRTATHEVGHWMNLRHIWGDATCGTDYVSDTPTHNAPNYGVPSTGHRSTCSGTPLEMYMNYMDYTDDRGMYMFSKGQVSRMAAIFSSTGSRRSFR